MSDKLKAHIIAPHENQELPLYKLIQMAGELLNGNIPHVEEKLDGQNITFTVINGELQFFNKGLTSRRLAKAITGEQPGNRLADMSQYRDPGLREAFETAYRAIEDIFSKNVGLVEKVFENGRFAIESSVMGPNNKNTISYSTTHFRMIQYVSMFGDYPDYISFSTLSKRMSRSTALNISNVTSLKHLGNSSQYDFMTDITSLATKHGLSRASTIGELTQKLTESYLKVNTHIPIGLIEDASRRLAWSQKSALSHRSFSNKSDWESFQALEKRGTVAQAAIAPLEEILQRLAYDVFNSYHFELSGAAENSTAQTVTRVSEIIKAAQHKKINADQQTLDRIDDTIKRTKQLSLFRKDVEGIVFEWEEQQYKLTGLFTPINKILGYFHYNGATLE